MTATHLTPHVVLPQMPPMVSDETNLFNRLFKGVYRGVFRVFSGVFGVCMVVYTCITGAYRCTYDNKGVLWVYTECVII